MKKIVSLIVFFTLFINISFAEYLDVLYIKNSPSLVREFPKINSNIIWELKRWYVVIDYWEVSKHWTKVKLTDGKIWYIFNFNFDKNIKSKYQVNWNYWNITRATLLKNLPSEKAHSTFWELFKDDTFEVLHLNYLNNSWIKVKITSWKKNWKIWYINKEYAKTYCDYSSLNNILFNTFGEKNIPDSTYCSKILNSLNGTNNTNDDDFLDNLFDEFNNVQNEPINTNDDNFLDNLFGEFNNVQNEPINTNEDDFLDNLFGEFNKL